MTKPKQSSQAHPDRSIPADADKDGVGQPAQPGAGEQSGSTGRRVADGNPAPGPDTGQDQYGQSGYAGTPRETDGQADYRRSDARGDPRKKRSNRGSSDQDPAPPRVPDSGPKTS
jgi:hypothetical protein